MRRGSCIILFVCLCLSSLPDIKAETQSLVSGPEPQTYSYSTEDLPEVCFFPVLEARWNGYEVLNKNWRSLDDYLKQRFIAEAAKEIQDKEGFVVSYNSDEVPEIIEAVDKEAERLTNRGEPSPAIAILTRILYERGNAKGTYLSPIDIVSEQIASGDRQVTPYPEAEIGKVYTGYISCYERDGNWVVDSAPPEPGETKRLFIYETYQVYPTGKVIMSNTFPLFMEYKIISLEEINSFLDDYGLQAHYYKITFEPVREIF